MTRETLIHLGFACLAYAIYIPLAVVRGWLRPLGQTSLSEAQLAVQLFADQLPVIVAWTLSAFLAGRATRLKSPWPGAVALALILLVLTFGGLRIWGGQRISSAFFGDPIFLAPHVVTLALLILAYRFGWKRSHAAVPAEPRMVTA
jgi:hypothetical protein